MAKQTESIFNFDMTRILSDLRVPGLPDAATALPSLPGIEVLTAAHQRNMDTIAAANKLALDGMQAILRRQGEIVRTAVEDASAMAGRLSATADLSQRLSFQADALKDSFERSTSSMRELAEMVATSNTEVIDLLNRRVVEAFDELSEALRKQPMLGDAGLRATVAESAAAEAKPAPVAAAAAPAAAEVKAAAAPTAAAAKPAPAKTNGSATKAAAGAAPAAKPAATPAK
ncbi:phasin family protein [Novispirillum sp. DQ9]|uniref:phasin family protein n=1 Tax=Novispirillum sp. DQ9 TaxID=3398612 RepID=UPI003C7B172D